MNSTNDQIKFEITKRIFTIEYMPYVILNIFGTIFGILGNLMIFLAILCTKRLKTISNIIIFNLTICHFLVCAIVNPFSLLGIFYEDRLFIRFPGLCLFVATLCTLVCVTGSLNMTLLSFDRYIYVCHSELYPRIFTKSKTIIFCIITWLLALCADIPQHFDDSRQLFDSQLLACFFDRNMNKIVFIGLHISNKIIPLFCLTFFYGSIFSRIKRAISLGLSQRLNTSSFVQKSLIEVHQNDSLNDLKQTMKFSKGLFISYSMFTLTLVPFSLINIIDTDHILPFYFHLYPWMLYRLCSTINPIIYPLFHSSFFYGYKNVLSLIIFRKKINFSKRPKQKSKRNMNCKKKPSHLQFKLIVNRFNNDI